MTSRGHRYMLTFFDFRRYAKAVTISEQTAEETAMDFLTSWVTLHGVPRMLLADQGRNFVSGFFTNLCKGLGIRQRPITRPLLQVIPLISFQLGMRWFPLVNSGFRPQRTQTIRDRSSDDTSGDAEGGIQGSQTNGRTNLEKTDRVG